MEYFKTKAAAKKQIATLGYSIHFDTGSCGDRAHGSREYFRKPTSVMNEFGFPKTEHATISRLPKGWVISEFGKVSA